MGCLTLQFVCTRRPVNRTAPSQNIGAQQNHETPHQRLVPAAAHDEHHPGRQDAKDRPYRRHQRDHRRHAAEVASVERLQPLLSAVTCTQLYPTGSTIACLFFCISVITLDTRLLILYHTNILRLC